MRLTALFPLLLASLLWVPAWAPAADLCAFRYKQIQGWRGETELLDRQLSQLPQDERDGYRDFLDALYFIDYKDAAPELLDHFLKGTPLWRSRFPYREEGGFWLWRFQLTQGHSALANYRAGRDLLKRQRSDISVDVLARLHGKLFEGDRSVPSPGAFRPQGREEARRALEEFYRSAGELGALRSPAKQDAFVKLVAGFHQKLVTILPFGEGSERAATVLMNHLLEGAGLSPARILDPGRAATVSAEAWAEEVRLGIQSTRNLRDDLGRRLRDGIPIEQSIEYLTPLIPREVVVAHQTEGHKYRDDDTRIASVSSGQFAAWLRVRLEGEPALRTALRGRPTETMSQLYGDFKKYVESKRLDYLHRAAGEEQLELNLVEPDFYREFAVSTFQDLNAWRAKLDRWNQPDLVWRGLSYASRVMPDAEIASMFRQIHPQLVSTTLLKARTANPGQLRRLALQDFDRYNRDLVSGDLRNMARDHSETGPMYGNSYGLSTSRRPIVGQAFAMGAMVVAPYGEHRAPEFQETLKDRIVVGSYRGKKDVDLARLKQLDPLFSYKYGRQMEVMAIGAVDPDAVMVVQRLDTEGQVVTSYVRNPKNPAEVWVVTGDFSPESGRPPPRNRLRRTISLLPAPPGP